MPRVEYEDRVEYRNDAGELHRDGDLPARDWNNGAKSWWLNDKLHRLDNPAVIYSDGDSGTKYWWLNGQPSSESKYYPALYIYKGILNA